MACDIRKAKGHTLSAVRNFYANRGSSLIQDRNDLAATEIENESFSHGAVFFVTSEASPIDDESNIVWAAYIQTHEKEPFTLLKTARVIHLANNADQVGWKKEQEILDDFREFITVAERYAIQRACTAIAAKISVRSSWINLFSQLQDYRIVSNEFPWHGDLLATFEKRLLRGFRGDAAEWLSLVDWYLDFSFGEVSKNLGSALSAFRVEPGQRVDFTLIGPALRELSSTVTNNCEIPLRLICLPNYTDPIDLECRKDSSGGKEFTRFTILAREENSTPRPVGIDMLVLKKHIIGMVLAVRDKIADTQRLPVNSTSTSAKRSLLHSWHTVSVGQELHKRAGLVVEIDRESFLNLLERLNAPEPNKIRDFLYFFNDGHFARRANAGTKVFFYVWDAPIGIEPLAPGQPDERWRGCICAVGNLVSVMPRSQSEIFKLLKLNGRFEPKWCSPPPGKDDYGKHAIFEQPFISRFFDADVVLMEVNWLTTFDARSLDSDGSYFGVDYDGFLRIVFPNWDGLQEDAKALARKLLPEWEVGNTYLDRDQTSALTKKLEGSLGLQKKIWLAPKGGGSENVEPIGPARAMVRQLQPAHVSAMVDILANHAAGSFDTPQEFFKDLVEASCLPRVWTQEFAGGFQGDPQRDARRLVAWAINRGLNPDDPRYTALGAVLNALLLQKLSPDDARTVAAIVVGYGLIRDNNLLYDIRIRYRVPVAPLAPPGAQINYGPDFVWRGPADIDLQSLISPPLDWQDVGFLMRAMSCASSVCRVEVGPTRGTGFLVAPALALTNYHVLKPEPTDDIEANARSAVLRFGCITSSRGEASKGQEFKLAPEPIIERSCVGEFDFVLLKVEEKILAEKAIQPTPLASDLPAKGTALNILHHPGGNTMKLSTSENGVTGIYEERGLVQYVTSAIDGSSGSPCFDDNWEVVALHHAQRSRSWGSVREGILIHSILQRIQQYL